MPASQAIADRKCPDLPRHRTGAGPELNTEDLVAAARRGERAAWEELTTRYGGMVHGVVASYRLQDADVADAMQMTWLRAFERLDKLRDPERLGGWLATIAGRECLALLRRARWETPDEAVAGDCAAGAPGPEAQVLVAEARGAVRAAVARLSGRRRRLVHALFYLPERDYHSLADELGMPVGSIGPTRGRVLRSLRGALEPAGFGSSVCRGTDDPDDPAGTGRGDRAPARLSPRGGAAGEDVGDDLLHPKGAPWPTPRALRVPPVRSSTSSRSCVGWPISWT